jgi:hypothetical protein
MSAANSPRQVLLLGSVPLSSANEVFETVAAALGPLVRRIPDGETGVRKGWLTWQQEVFAAAAGLEPGGERVIHDGRFKFITYKVKSGGTPGDVRFGPLHYAENARKSYADFKRLRSAGKIAAGTRFQVSMPTPLALVFGFVVPAEIHTIWPIFEQRMRQEIDEIAAAIPHRDLAIQWDIAVELDGILEVPAVAKNFPIDQLVGSIARVSNHIPAAIELGLHLCYGDPGHKHIVEPKDTGVMVDLANRLAAAIDRPIGWLHMPVPRDRDDDGYFAPLRNLKLKPGEEFYLGLVHRTDGVAGAQRRLAAAKRVIADFGVATECGLGRRPPETIAELWALHRTVASLC